MCPIKHKQKHHHCSTAATATATVEDWREESINGGSLKHVDLQNGSNGWASPPGEVFSLRGPNYFAKKFKVPSGDWMLNLVGVDWLRSNSKLNHVLSKRDNRVMASLRSSKTPEKWSKTFILMVNLQVPSRDHHSEVFYFSSKVDEPIDPNSLLYQFIHGGPNYLEIDVDIGSSAIATAILHLALGCVPAVTVDMAFLVESQSEEELPERLFGAVRICQIEMSSAAFVDSATPWTGSFFDALMGWRFAYAETSCGTSEWCLNKKREERPSMEEVAMELEALRLVENHQWRDEDLNHEEIMEHLFNHTAASNFNGGFLSNHKLSGNYIANEKIRMFTAEELQRATNLPDYGKFT
ncbi:unnamed protein product [Fraxinus pennsylvanica]|uniref:Protein ENHANCED DISEASE RESISTANCE 2 C-terminal domain-containing protein n=1 Tax=Fraxinus pennsylvanica TaxID=56036 RepID=A0AAD1YVG4_9LAMI|nr:unnamed protein product [Fraxinus pennsylvanica]